MQISKYLRNISVCLALFGLGTGVYWNYKTLKDVKMTLAAMESKQQFLAYETAKINERWRQEGLKSFDDSKQTLASFDYQWENLSEGSWLPSDAQFMEQIQSQICSMTGLPSEWFKGKKIIDIGSGNGRFTYGLLLLGADVTACDASAAGLKYTLDLCKPYQSHLSLIQANILKDPLPQSTYDLAFSFGVVHHTGNTYLAIKNVCDTVKPGGKVFLMVYGYPEKNGDFVELSEYEALREELRHLTFEQKADHLRSRYSENLVNGVFDAASPKINDLLKYGELVELLHTNGMRDVQRTNDNRNLHVVGSKIAN